MNALDQVLNIHIHLSIIFVIDVESILLDIQEAGISIVHVKTRNCMYQYVYNAANNTLNLLKSHNIHS